MEVFKVTYTVMRGNQLIYGYNSSYKRYATDKSNNTTKEIIIGSILSSHLQNIISTL